MLFEKGKASHSYLRIDLLIHFGVLRDGLGGLRKLKQTKGAIVSTCTMQFISSKVSSGQIL